MAKGATQKAASPFNLDVNPVDILNEAIEEEQGIAPRSSKGTKAGKAISTKSAKVADNVEFEEQDQELNEEPEEEQEDEPEDEELDEEISQATQKQDVNKLYKESTKEGKRLYRELKDVKQELKKYEKFTPFLDAIETDEGLAQLVIDYYSGKVTPSGQKQELPEDFIFDPIEAKDPNTPSGKYIGNLVNKQVSEILGNYEKNRTAKDIARSREQNRLLARKDFIKSHPELDEDDIDELEDFAKKTPVSLEHIWMIKNQDTLLKNVASKARQSIRDQARTVNSKPRTLSTAGSTKTQPSVADQMFKMLAGMTEADDSLIPKDIVK